MPIIFHPYRIYVEGVDGDVDSVRIADIALLSGDLSVKYDSPPDPPLSDVERQWVNQLTGRDKTS